MANETKPYFKDGKWYIDVDPDDQNNIVADVSADLTSRGTTASSVACVIKNVLIMEGPAVQGALMAAKITMDGSDTMVDHYATFRVSCANGERFDRTIWFNLESH